MSDIFSFSLSNMSSYEDIPSLGEEGEEEEQDAEALAASWALEDADIQKGKVLRTLNRTRRTHSAANLKLSQLADEAEMMKESIQAQENHIIQLDAELGEGRQRVLTKRREINGLKIQLQNQRDEYNATHRLLQLELSGMQRLPRWWILVMIMHVALAYSFIRGTRLVSGIAHFVMFMTHFRSIYVKTGSVPSIISLGLFCLEVVWIARTLN